MGFLGHTRGSRDDVAISSAEPAAPGRRCFSGRNRDKIRRLTQYKAQCRSSHVRNGARAARVLRPRAPTKESRGNNLRLHSLVAIRVCIRCKNIRDAWELSIIRDLLRDLYYVVRRCVRTRMILFLKPLFFNVEKIVFFFQIQVTLV